MVKLGHGVMKILAVWWAVCLKIHHSCDASVTAWFKLGKINWLGFLPIGTQIA